MSEQLRMRVHGRSADDTKLDRKLSKSIIAELDSKIWLDTRQLPDEIQDQIRSALTVANPEYETARKEEKAGWEDMDPYLKLYVEFGDKLIVPRGFALSLKRGLFDHGITIKYDDQRGTHPGDFSSWNKLATPRNGQEEAVKEILRHQQGIIEATPGWGKTVMMLEAIRQSGMKALVVVDKTNIMKQWMNRAHEHFGAESGMIGNGVWKEKDLTIAMQQTLWSRRKELDREGFFEKWGIVCLDECHHASARTYSIVMEMFNAKYRIGLSATPNKQDGTQALIVCTIGEVIFQPGKKKLREAGQLIEPHVVRVPTNFEFDFVRTHRRPDGALVRNNYTKMMGRLVEDVHRNKIIARKLERGRAHLVVSDRLIQLDEIARIAKNDGWPEEKLLFLTGREDMGERDRVTEAVDGDCVVFSTIAKEAVDIPRLEVLHLAWPIRKTHILKQTVGRIERGHKDKTRATVYDYFEPKVSVLRSQSRDRASFYRDEGFEVQTIEPKRKAQEGRSRRAG